MSAKQIKWFSDCTMDDVLLVGGKGASLGEMYRGLHKRGVLIPNGFTVTVDAYHKFVDTPVVEGAWGGVAEVEDVESKYQP